ncbi:Hypothetical protein GbCGDNIH5_8159 [Granulibacter bethesdensis]|nr:Hypothetical protein GbCGDNIH5_8159 [Granulibacter bethesdensis]
MMSEVYLRARGGTPLSGGAFQRHGGLSPRTRRNRCPLVERLAAHGSISAHAEEPTPPLPRGRALGVYLRARGGTWDRYRRPA